MTSSTNNNAAFSTHLFRYQINEPLYSFTSKIPMNYKLVGYVLTTTKEEHQTTMGTKTPVQVDVSINPEIWLTTYIEPVTEMPSAYHWEYKENNLGTIKLN